MNAENTLARLRRFLLVFADLLFAGTLLELIFTGHTAEPIQWIPFILCGLGLMTCTLALVRNTGSSLVILRWSMVLIGVGSLFGMYEHITNNIAFQLEIHPGLTLFEQLAAGLGGANPLLAPGILGAAAVLSLAATYRHPVLAADQHPLGNMLADHTC